MLDVNVSFFIVVVLVLLDPLIAFRAFLWVLPGQHSIVLINLICAMVVYKLWSQASSELFSQRDFFRAVFLNIRDE
jgi:hypothetical protein